MKDRGKRITIWITARQRAFLGRVRTETGWSMSELCRHAIDLFETHRDDTLQVVALSGKPVAEEPPPVVQEQPAVPPAKASKRAEIEARNAEHRQRIIDMHLSGMHRKEIAALVGKTPGAIRHTIARYTRSATASVEMPPPVKEPEPIVEKPEQARYTDADVSGDRSHFVSVRVLPV